MPPAPRPRASSAFVLSSERQYVTVSRACRHAAASRLERYPTPSPVPERSNELMSSAL